MNFMFYFNSILLGIGLAMDAFSVSLANGLSDLKMKTAKMTFIAGVFAFFQFLMPVIGWICVHTIANQLKVFEKCIPYIALVLLVFIGGKMLIEGLKKDMEFNEPCSVGFVALIVQGIATSIDALSVGFTISSHTFKMAFVCCLIIAVVTFFICYAGLVLGKKFGTKLSNKASLIGGSILILIGLEIFINGVFI